MARGNRVSVPDGIYHVTARIANRAMLLAKDEVKDKILRWIVSVADFSGVVEKSAVVKAVVVDKSWWTVPIKSSDARGQSPRGKTHLA